MACPSNAIIYNSSLCACPPGQLYNRRNNSCFLFRENSEIDMDSGVDYYSVSFPETIFSFDSIKKFSQSQAVFLEATLVMVLSWLLCCLFLRFMKLGDGRSIWFKLRWWLSRFDLCYSTRHWLVISFFHVFYYCHFILFKSKYSRHFCIASYNTDRCH